MDCKAGDRIEVTLNSVGAQPRVGSVLAATSTGGLRVLWNDGHETVFFPAGNCRVVPSENGDRNGSIHVGLHIDVDVVEDPDACTASASVMTNHGLMRAEGVARRKPADPNIPMVGEELAIGRALVDLGDQLMSAASDDLFEPHSQHDHLVSSPMTPSPLTAAATDWKEVQRGVPRP